MTKFVGIFPFVLVPLLGATAPGCERKELCPPPTTSWVCSVDLMPKAGCVGVCGGTMTYAQTDGCGVTAMDAAEDVTQKWAAQGYTATLRKECWHWDMKSVLSEEPKLMLETVPSCEPSADDDACVACAKASCCGEYQGCTNDPNCLCWVGCEYAGNAVDVCAQPVNCGPLSPTSSAAAACLTAGCPAECGTMKTMGGACMCGTASTSASSGGGGAFGAGGSPFGGGGSPFNGGSP
jgi:hypothetical protein